MHYKNGREAKNGDLVVNLPSVGAPVVGILHSAVSTSETCNGRLALPTVGDPYVTIGECLHVDDVKDMASLHLTKKP